MHEERIKMTSVTNPHKLILEEFLNFLESAIDEKRRVLEEICQETEELFKPWPKVISSEENDNRNKKKENDTLVDATLMSTQEQEEMTLVNSLLKRAEKARMIHQKIIEKEKSADILESGGLSSSSKKCNNDKTDLNKKNGNEESNDSEKVNAKIEEMVKKHETVTKNTLKSSREIASGETVNINNKQTGTWKSQKLSTSTNQFVRYKVVDRPASSRSTNSIRSRPSSKGSVKTTRSISSTRNKTTSAHMTAPFQTNPNIKIPKKNYKDNRALLAPKPVIKSKYLNSTKSNKTNMEKRKTAQNIDRHLEQKHSAQVQLKDVKESENISYYSRTDNHVIPESDNIVKTEELKAVFNDPNNASKTELNSSKVRVDTPHDVIENLDKLHLDNTSLKSDKNSNGFLLSKDGSKLEVPSKLKKLLGKNRKIRQKVSKISMTQKIGTSNRENFCTSIESLFDKQTCLAIKYRKLQCLKSHNKLQELLSHLQLNTINELSNPHDVLHAKMMIEFILTTYHELEEETQLLLSDTSKDKSLFELTSIERPEFLPDRWLPAQINSYKIDIPHQISYTNKRDLQHFQTSLFKFQHLQFQKHIINLIQMDFFPELQSIDCTSRNYRVFHQSIAALLTNQGKHFPE